MSSLDLTLDEYRFLGVESTIDQHLGTTIIYFRVTYGQHDRISVVSRSTCQQHD